MTEDETGIEDMIGAATELGKKRKELEKRNARRKAKGRPPLLDEQELADREVTRLRHRTGKPVTVDGATALKLFEQRRAAMLDGEDPDDVEERDDPEPQDKPARDADVPTASSSPVQADESMERAQKEAAAARQVSDMKNGRIDHDGIWGGGQKLEGGDDTRLPEKPSKPSKPSRPSNPEGSAVGDTGIGGAMADAAALIPGWLLDFRNDLYFRLKESFAGMEQTLSDLQGRVAELSAQTSSDLQGRMAEAQGNPGGDEFAKLLEKRVPVVFDVGGAKMSFDAITVFHAPPCITVVTKIGSATITPRPGATLRLSYEMDGITYKDDPVTYLGTRFELPMFGLSFTGFIRDLEASQLDVDAGREPSQIGQ